MQREHKTELITLRVTPRVKEAIRKCAREASLTVTDYLCYSGLGKEIVRVDGLDKVLSELKAQGRNLNQLTTLANMGRITAVNVREACALYADIQRSLKALLERTV